MRNFAHWRKIVGATLAVALLAFPLAWSARAEMVDFSKVTCEEFMNLDEDAMAGYYIWLEGYFSGKSGNTVLDTDTVEEDLTKLVELCNDSPKSTVLKVLGQ